MYCVIAFTTFCLAFARKIYVAYATRCHMYSRKFLVWILGYEFDEFVLLIKAHINLHSMEVF